MLKNKAKSKHRYSDLDLHITLDEVKRSNGHVSESTAEYTAGGAGSIESRRVHLDLPKRLLRSRNHHPPAAVGGGGRGSGGRGGGGGAGVEDLVER